MGSIVFGVTHCGPFFIDTVECSVVETFNASDRFLSMDKIDLSCEPRLRMDPTSMQFLGPGFSHSGMVYGNSDHNIRCALPRLTADPVSEFNLAENQRKFLKTRLAKRTGDALHKHFTSCLEKAKPDLYDHLIAYADLPHPKRALRVQAALEILENNLFTVRGACQRMTYISRVSTKLKKFEWGKPGKKPRLICDLSTVGSLLSGYCAELVKKWLGEFHHEHNPIYYCKSSTQHGLRAAFELMKRTGFVYFSDDSCYAHDDFRANVDISSCDGSHTRYLFDFILSTIPNGFVKDAIAGSISQLQIDLTVKRASGKKWFTLKHNKRSAYSTTLYSGSTLTTLVNNYANLLIGTKLISFGAKCVRDVVNTAALVGYNVTADVCEKYQQLQFLKHSPNAAGEPWLNLGVIMRTCGVSRGHIPGRRLTLREKSYQFMASITDGLCWAGDSHFYRCMAEKYTSVERSHPTSVFAHSTWRQAVNESTPTNVPIVSLDDVCARYGITESQYLELVQLFKEADFGDLIRCDASDIILEKDYGYKPATSHSCEISSR